MAEAENRQQMDQTMVSAVPAQHCSVVSLAAVAAQMELLVERMGTIYAQAELVEMGNAWRLINQLDLTVACTMSCVKAMHVLKGYAVMRNLQIMRSVHQTAVVYQARVGMICIMLLKHL